MAHVTIRDVARLAGVSDGTVSNAVNRPHLVNAVTRERVLAAMAEIGYIPNAAARALRLGRSRTIGLVVLDFGNPFFAAVASGAEHAASEAGADIALFNTGIGRHDRERRLLNRLAERHLDGLVITPNDINDPLLAVIEERGTPVVVLGREVPDRRRSAVRSDDVLGGELAARHLLDYGHRRMAFAGWRHDERYQGATALASSADATLTWMGTQGDGVADGLAVGHRLAELPIAERPTAVFCANDLIATGVVQAVTHHRMRIPRDLAVVGFDGTDLASAAAAVELTSVHQPAEQLGEAAVGVVLSEMRDPARGHRDIVFQPQLVIRESTRHSCATDRPMSGA